MNNDEDFYNDEWDSIKEHEPSNYDIIMSKLREY